MPELPEIETIRRGLEEDILGRIILDVSASKSRVLRTDPRRLGAALKGRKFTKVQRRGKMLILALEGQRSEERGYLLVRLGMTGRLTVSDKRHPETSGRHQHALVEFKGGKTLAYSDPRQFGSLELVDEAGLGKKLGEFGPEPLDPGFGAKNMERIVRGRTTSIKALLLDQRRIAGIGNIYADEILFLSGLDPQRSAGSLTGAEADRLSRATRRILKAAVEKRGTTFSDYVDAQGNIGGYQNHLKVYGKAGKPCPGCGGKIERIRVAGRGTNYCPRCQR